MKAQSLVWILLTFPSDIPHLYLLPWHPFGVYHCRKCWQCDGCLLQWLWGGIHMPDEAVAHGQENVLPSAGGATGV